MSTRVTDVNGKCHPLGVALTALSGPPAKPENPAGSPEKCGLNPVISLAVSVLALDFSAAR